MRSLKAYSLVATLIVMGLASFAASATPSAQNLFVDKGGPNEYSQRINNSTASTPVAFNVSTQYDEYSTTLHYVAQVGSPSQVIGMSYEFLDITTGTRTIYGATSTNQLEYCQRYPAQNIYVCSFNIPGPDVLELDHGITYRFSNDYDTSQAPDDQYSYFTINRANSAQPECSDGLDNDGDGQVDYPNDTGCASASDNFERGSIACDDGLDNDGDGQVDYPNDSGCDSILDNTETSPACSDGLDNDGDGQVDYPNDSGCSSASDTSEVGSAACNDGLDNDGDGQVDYPNDPGCTSATDSSEYGTAQCDNGVDDNGDGRVDYPNDPGCTSLTDTTETTLVCDDGKDNDGDGRVDYPSDPGCTSATDSSEYGTAQCDNGVDDNGDGNVDYPDDPGCTSLTDTTETNQACNDGVDNDGDGRVDYPSDPGCASASDPSEINEKCSDGEDNDGDGKIDYPDDDGCTSPVDTNEASLTDCGSLADGDGDGASRFPNDAGCATYGDKTSNSYVCEGANCVCAFDQNGDGEINVVSEVEQCSADAYGRWSCPLEKVKCEMYDMQVENPDGLGVTTVQEAGCPLGLENPCVTEADGQKYCSLQPCVDPTVKEQQDTAGDWPEDSGPRDSEGNCLGELSMMGGSPKRCRRSGTQTAWQNCCKTDMAPLNDTMGAEGEPSQRDYREEHSSFEFWENQCDTEDQSTALLAKSDYCFYIGSYCAEKWPLVGCVQRAQSYCCFNSRLAKMIQEQGRPQLESMGNFGSPSNPDCRGFTPEEFQQLDFSKMDLSAYSSSIRTKAQTEMQFEAQSEAVYEANNP